MFLVLFMVIDPAGGWGRVAESARSFARTLFFHLCPLLLLGCVADGYGMMHWGKRISQFGPAHTFGLAEVLKYQACHFAVGMVVVFLGAVVLQRLGNTFHRRQRFANAFAVSVFGLGPIFLLRILDAFPSIHPWLGWLIGAAITAAILYQGVPRVMHLDPSHALGVYMSGMLFLVFASLLGRLLVIGFLQTQLLGVKVPFW